MNEFNIETDIVLKFFVTDKERKDLLDPLNK